MVAITCLHGPALDGFRSIAVFTISFLNRKMLVDTSSGAIIMSHRQMA